MLVPVAIGSGVLFLLYEGYNYLTSKKAPVAKPGASPSPKPPMGGLQSSYGPGVQPTNSTAAIIKTVTTGSTVNVRKTPATGSVAGSLPDGAHVWAEGVFTPSGAPTTGTGASVWIKVQDQLSSLNGYVRGDFVVLNAVPAGGGVGMPPPAPGTNPKPPASGGIGLPPPAQPAPTPAPATGGSTAPVPMHIKTATAGSSVNVRAAPLNGTVLGMLKDGASVLADFSKTADDSGHSTPLNVNNEAHVWVWVGDQSSPLSGYVRSDFVRP